MGRTGGYEYFPEYEVGERVWYIPCVESGGIAIVGPKSIHIHSPVEGVITGYYVNPADDTKGILYQIDTTHLGLKSEQIARERDVLLDQLTQILKYQFRDMEAEG